MWAQHGFPHTHVHNPKDGSYVVREVSVTTSFAPPSPLTPIVVTVPLQVFSPWCPGLKNKKLSGSFLHGCQISASLEALA